MPDAPGAQLYLTTAMILQDLAYLLPCERAEEDRKVPIMSESVRIDFGGARHGSLHLRISASALAEMSANMLGREESPCLALRRDALGEFASILCGNLLPAAFGCGPAFDIRPPRFPEGDEADSYSGTLAGRAEVWLEAGGCAEAMLFIAEEDPGDRAHPPRAGAPVPVGGKRRLADSGTNFLFADSDPNQILNSKKKTQALLGWDDR